MTKKGNSSLVVEDPHAKEILEVLDALSASEEGLSSVEADQRLEDIGPNRLPEADKESLFRRFFKHFNDLLIYILIAAAGVTALLGHWVDTAVILAVVVINAVIGFIQEGKAEKALAGIRGMLSLKAHVLRDGDWQELEADQLVPGDIVRLRSGDKVPADLRLLEAVNLRIEESALTGESVPTDKKPEPAEAASGIGDRHCLAFSGTMVAAGRGVGVVSATGPATELGKINKMIADVESLETPLTIQMKRFSKQLSIAILGMAVLMGLAGWLLHGYGPEELFLAAIGFAVAAIPEGMPAILTIILAMGVQRMARRNAITRKLKAVETLGSVTVICSDKTGTLTKNEMTVLKVVTKTGEYQVAGSGYRPDGDIRKDDTAVSLEDHDQLRTLVEVMAVCNDTELREEDGQWKILGEPTEGALVTLARKSGFDSKGYERRDVIPFESENKFMATLNSLPSGETRILLKGAPDRLLDRCTSQLGTGKRTESLERSYWNKQIDELGSQGLRVLAAAFKDTDKDKKNLDLKDIEGDMIFAGLVGIIDPPRPEAIEAIKTCHTAGIRVIMITGDHAGTASAIAKQMGIGDGSHTVTGAELEKQSDDQLRELVKDTLVFARTSPEHKLRLVQALQANGDVVAMTGDGVNDAPALKRADVGVAMGIKGTEATKEAAKIVLADDNFTSIEHAVEEGRTIYDNLRKAILFILPTNGAEALVVLAAVSLGMVLPLTPVQILWVNMITAVALDMSMTFEPAELDIMARSPRKPGSSILNISLLWRIGFVSLLLGGATSVLFFLELKNGSSLEVSRTLAVNILVFGQIFYLFNSRYLEKSSLHLKRLVANKVTWISVGIVILFQLLFVYAPFMHGLFGSASLTLRQWLIPLGVGTAVFLLVEVQKGVSRFMKRR